MAGLPRRRPVDRHGVLPWPLHRSNRPSLTALSVTLWRALEARRPESERIVDDPYAQLFLPRTVQAALPGLVRASSVLDLPERSALTGLGTYVVCRHRFIDEHLLTAVAGGARQVVLLGAGYDSRAYRLREELAGADVYEVDLPPLSRLKARVVAEHPAAFGVSAVRRVEIDFRTQYLRPRLLAAGFSVGLPTVVVWEGVAPYLSAEAVAATLTDLGELVGPGSTLAMDLWDGGGADLLAPVRRAGALTLALVGEPVTYSVTPLDASGLLAAHGFDVLDLAESDQLTARYATGGRVAARSVYVLAAGT